jgi:3-oxoacyl-[acyl-carrier protein] reductase
MNILVTGSRKGIGLYLTNVFLERGFTVFGCSRSSTTLEHPNYRHYIVDVSNEHEVKAMFKDIRLLGVNLDVLINNAGVASMNHSMLTPISTVERLMRTNFNGTFLFSREALKLMQKTKQGRIINFSTVAVPLNLHGEAVYASSKSAVETLTRVMAKEVGEFGITINAVAPTPIDTDLTRTVPKNKLTELISQQAIKRMGNFDDVLNVIDFFIKPESSFITGQVIYLGGVF